MKLFLIFFIASFTVFAKVSLTPKKGWTKLSSNKLIGGKVIIFAPKKSKDPKAKVFFNHTKLKNAIGNEEFLLEKHCEKTSKAFKEKGVILKYNNKDHCFIDKSKMALSIEKDKENQFVINSFKFEFLNKEEIQNFFRVIKYE